MKHLFAILTLLTVQPISAHTVFLKTPIALTGAKDWCNWKEAFYRRIKATGVPIITNLIAHGKTFSDFVSASGDLKEAALRRHAKTIQREGESLQQASVRLRETLQKRSFVQTGYTECARVKEYETMIFCFSFRTSDMTSMFTRMSGHFEGLVSLSKGQIAKLGTLELKTLQKIIGGHNLRGDSIVEFWRQLGEGKTNPHEKEFQQVVLPEVKKTLKDKGSAYLAAGSYTQPYHVFGHELLHGPWEETPGYKEAVKKYLEGVSEEDLNLLTSHIGPVQKSGLDQFANEFQAYVLSPNIHRHLKAELRQLAQQHRKPLAKAIRSAGLTVPQLQPGWCEEEQPPLD